ncbi:hypothetical protein [Halosimplex salinum]|uniref:hypothetical protein n=1 Tax=Halosimplex salinum TaxID=1710538 RepID=UPI0019D0848F|nr:hypothetical protein [Halosimplex salinum]
MVAGLGLAGCLGGNNSPPPRKAKVFDDVSLDGTQMQIQLESDVEVESRLEAQDDLDAGGAVGALLPVGRARAAKGAGARGAGGYSSAPKGRHGWAVWHGGSYGDDWRDDHDDDIKMYDATVATLGVAYLGSDDSYQNDPPGPGPVSWDEKWDDPSEGDAKSVDLAAISPGSDTREGWYRVGTELVADDGSRNFDWQAADFEVDNDVGRWNLDKEWHVKPRV